MTDKTDRELIQMALEMLELCYEGKSRQVWGPLLVMAKLRERLAQPDQEPVLQDIEQYRMQMASISAAAIGYWKECDGIRPDYDTPVLRDVAMLYAKYDALYKAQPEQKPVAQMREMLEVQGRDGTWDCDTYSLGMYNGMEFMVALAEGREPVFRGPPERWLHTPQQREWQGLTDEERDAIDKSIPDDTDLLVAKRVFAREIVHEMTDRELLELAAKIGKGI